MPTDIETTTADDQAIVEEIHGDLDRTAMLLGSGDSSLHDVYTDLNRPEVGEK